MNKNSPFYVKQDLISPMMAEDIIDSLNFKAADIDENGNQLKSLFFDSDIDEVIFERISPLIKDLERHYGIEYVGTSPMTYEYYASGYNNSEIVAENSVHLKGKWLRVKNLDLTCVLFLSTYNDNAEFDNEFDVYGGKLEFPQHKFAVNPEQGTLIVYPSDPHFLNTVTPVILGDSVMVRFHMTAKAPLLYDHTKFEGDYTEWFKEFG